MNTQTKNLNLNNIPECLIRQVRAAAASEGKPLYVWAIEAFEEKLDFDRYRDPGSVTERLRNALLALGGQGCESGRLKAAREAVAPLLITDFPEHLREEYSSLMADWSNAVVDTKNASERLLNILMKIWGPTWHR